MDRWLEIYAPATPDVELHPCFVAACKYQAQFDFYYFQGFVNNTYTQPHKATDEDFAFLLALHGDWQSIKEIITDVENIERERTS
jgi:hypothetical protein